MNELTKQVSKLASRIRFLEVAAQTKEGTPAFKSL
jgi:hypothetical protein